MHFVLNGSIKQKCLVLCSTRSDSVDNLWSFRLCSFEISNCICCGRHFFYWADKLYWALRSFEGKRCARHLRAHKRATQLERRIQFRSIPHSATLRPPHALVQALSNPTKNRQFTFYALQLLVLVAFGTGSALMVCNDGPYVGVKTTKMREDRKRIFYCVSGVACICKLFVRVTI